MSPQALILDLSSYKIDDRTDLMVNVRFNGDYSPAHLSLAMFSLQQYQLECSPAKRWSWSVVSD